MKKLPTTLYFYRMWHKDGNWLGKDKKGAYILTKQGDSIIYSNKPTESTFCNSSNFNDQFEFSHFTVLLYVYKRTQPPQVV